MAEVVGEEEKGVEVVIVEEVMDDSGEVGVEEDLVATEVIEATEAIEATEEIGEEVISVSPTVGKHSKYAYKIVLKLILQKFLLSTIAKLLDFGGRRERSRSHDRGERGGGRGRGRSPSETPSADSRDRSHSRDRN